MYNGNYSWMDSSCQGWEKPPVWRESNEKANYYCFAAGSLGFGMYEPCRILWHGPWRWWRQQDHHDLYPYYQYGKGCNEGLGMDYKKAWFWTFCFWMVSMGFSMEHDISKVFLGVSSVMLSYGLVCAIFKRKALTIFLFVVMAVALCQLSVIAKEITYQRSEGNTVGDVAGDIAYAFCNIKTNLCCFLGAMKMAVRGDYSGFNLNYRFVMVGIMVPIMAISILFKGGFSTPRFLKRN